MADSSDDGVPVPKMSLGTKVGIGIGVVALGVGLYSIIRSDGRDAEQDQAAQAQTTELKANVNQSIDILTTALGTKADQNAANESAAALHKENEALRSQLEYLNNRFARVQDSLGSLIITTVDGKIAPILTTQNMFEHEFEAYKTDVENTFSSQKKDIQTLSTTLDSLTAHPIGSKAWKVLYRNRLDTVNLWIQNYNTGAKFAKKTAGITMSSLPSIALEDFEDISRIFDLQDASDGYREFRFQAPTPDITFDVWKEANKVTDSLNVLKDAHNKLYHRTTENAVFTRGNKLYSMDVHDYIKLAVAHYAATKTNLTVEEAFEAWCKKYRASPKPVWFKGDLVNPDHTQCATYFTLPKDTAKVVPVLDTTHATP